MPQGTKAEQIIGTFGSFRKKYPGLFRRRKKKAATKTTFTEATQEQIDTDLAKAKADEKAQAAAKEKLAKRRKPQTISRSHQFIEK